MTDDFDMNGSISATNRLLIKAGTGITMNIPPSLTTTNDSITMTATTGDVRLGLMDTGASSVSVNAPARDVLNNNGVFH